MTFKPDEMQPSDLGGQDTAEFEAEVSSEDVKEAIEVVSDLLAGKNPFEGGPALKSWVDWQIDADRKVDEAIANACDETPAQRKIREERR